MQNSSLLFNRSQTSTFPVLQAQLEELAKMAWTTEQAWRHPQFLLSSAVFSDSTTPTQMVDELIRHAGRVAPGFRVPLMIPRVLVTSIPFAAGTFEEDGEGWVTIKVSSSFSHDQLAAQTILAHEVCHYILNNAGIRKADFNLNERYTDLCMFICGFGSVFMAGYKRDAQHHHYRPGHRLGYLTDAEYEFAQHYVLQLRQSDKLAPPRELDAVKARLLKLLYGDVGACKRQIEAERRRDPQQSEITLYRNVIDRLERDRRR